MNYLRIFILDISNYFFPVVWFGSGLTEYAFVSFLWTGLRDIILDDLGSYFHEFSMKGLQFLSININKLLFVFLIERPGYFLD